MRIFQCVLLLTFISDITIGTRKSNKQGCREHQAQSRMKRFWSSRRWSEPPCYGLGNEPFNRFRAPIATPSGKVHRVLSRQLWGDDAVCKVQLPAGHLSSVPMQPNSTGDRLQYSRRHSRSQSLAQVERICSVQDLICLSSGDVRCLRDWSK